MYMYIHTYIVQYISCSFNQLTKKKPLATRHHLALSVASRQVALVEKPVSVFHTPFSSSFLSLHLFYFLSPFSFPLSIDFYICNQQRQADKKFSIKQRCKKTQTMFQLLLLSVYSCLSPVIDDFILSYWGHYNFVQKYVTQ